MWVTGVVVDVVVDVVARAAVVTTALVLVVTTALVSVVVPALVLDSARLDSKRGAGLRTPSGRVPSAARSQASFPRPLSCRDVLRGAIEDAQGRSL
jgi:hypothetical protein